MAMLLSEAVAAFTESGVPVAHYRFHDRVPPPYCEAWMDDGEPFGGSDDRNARCAAEYQFVLHTTDRDLTLEAAIEDRLDASGITWRKRGGYKFDDDLATMTYRMTVFER